MRYPRSAVHIEQCPRVISLGETLSYRFA